ncbi:conserved hypothetical protein [Candidatus Methylobacter favarea]|uniref:site-specific DNA-methyltransferase (adenine-specific) n=1 Tax=Candidatus Methylobacter favarea TaxID=2707345 RepID=A0A8S0YAU0_9GAMM|nr:site-specific DNA-methyltransferase [Candidatus Methylobacter favarea]CAA9892567.1 conserved hypothetical protein [Candidatus Methylobacter favarea]
MKKLNLHSPDFIQANIAKLAELFPNCVTETRAAGGTQMKAIDFDQLRQELSTSVVEGAQERYQLNWPGKREALLTANAPIAKTLRPCREESVDFDTTQNLFIEGDNLDALKLLQETYLGKIKMIYIDPPYNTGNDFIYEDDFAEDTENYKLRSNQKDAAGNRLVANTESNGRFHSDWLSMMYSRLKLARNLLRDDGVIFISIDDGEQANLKRLCDEVFGESNFLSSIAVKLSEATGVKMAHVEQRIPKLKEYVLFYKKTENVQINPTMIDKEKWDSEYRTVCLGISNEELENIKAIISEEDRTYTDLALVEEYLKKISFQPASVICRLETNQDLSEGWLFANAYRIVQFVTLTGGALNLARAKKESFKTELPPAFFVITPKNKAYLIKSDFNHESDLPRCKILFADQYLQVNSGDFWFDIKTTGLDNEGEVDFKKGKKPLKLLKRCIDLVCKNDDIILDFFSGSATTAHAVMQLNAEDNGKRKFIMVQLPEACDEKSEAYKAVYQTIAEIGKERIRRAGQKIKQVGEALASTGREKEQPVEAKASPTASPTNSPTASATPTIDIGFRVLKIDSSNMKDVYYTPDQLKQGDLEQFTDNIKDDRTAEDLLFQVLLDWGVDLTLPITQETIKIKDEGERLKDEERRESSSFSLSPSSFKEYQVFFVDDNALAACFDADINEAFVKELAARHPLRVVFRDAGFIRDSVKINIEQIFKLLSPQTEIKTL